MHWIFASVVLWLLVTRKGFRNFAIIGAFLFVIAVIIGVNS